MIRPELATVLHRWAESLSAGASVLVGVWLWSLGGLILQPIGILVCLVGLGWAVIALRRARFLRGVSAPGLVEFDEGQIGYYGAGQGLGGYIALRDLTEIRLVRMKDGQHWRLKDREGQAILIPVAAAGAAKLYDAFSTLPGIDMGALTAALDRDLPAQSLWRRNSHREDKNPRHSVPR